MLMRQIHQEYVQYYMCLRQKWWSTIKTVVAHKVLWLILNIDWDCVKIDPKNGDNIFENHMLHQGMAFFKSNQHFKFRPESGDFYRLGSGRLGYRLSHIHPILEISYPNGNPQMLPATITYWVKMDMVSSSSSTNGWW